MKRTNTKFATRQSRPLSAGKRSGVALLITLMTLALMTIIIVAFLGTMSWELQASRRNFEGQKARALAIMGMQTAIAQLRTAIGPTWEAPYSKTANFLSTTTPAYFYSISPGLLTRWSYTSTTPLSSYALFSTPSATDPITNVANLNAPAQDGTYPILGTNTALPVDWVNVLSNPKLTASSANQVVGRYAFWVDDENSKININTADGAMNTNASVLTTTQRMTYMGAGTPTEVSLQELKDAAGNQLSFTDASNMVAIARTVGFNSTKEMLRVNPANYGIYTNNVFNLTTASRSPDINIFGQPKMALIMGNVLNNPWPSTPQMLYNNATLQYLKELFPSQSGPYTSSPVLGALPALSMTDLFTSLTGPTILLGASSGKGVKWPMAFLEDQASAANLGGIQSTGDNSLWDNGQVIADYLSGTTPSGGTITWPPFTGSTTTATSYLSKYTKRQIDSIAIQVLSMVRDSDPDWANTAGSYTITSDMEFRGWLSGQLVNGVGRNPKQDKFYALFTTRGGTLPVPLTNATPPAVAAKLYVESWFPAGFQGVSLAHDCVPGGNYFFGSGGQRNMINCQDTATNQTSAGTNDAATGQPNVNSGGTTYVVEVPSPLLKLPGYTNNPATSYSYWGDDLLQVSVQGAMGYQTNAGIDWNGADPFMADSDQAMAALYHPYSTTNAAGQYLGGGSSPGHQNAPVFQMGTFLNGTAADASGIVTNEWAPGEYRTVSNRSAGNYWSPMAPNTAAGTISTLGGIALMTESDVNRVSDGPAPLDAMRGSLPLAVGDQNRTGETFATTTSPYTTVIAAIIPVNLSISVPASVLPPAVASLGNTVTLYGYVKDPLVNKFPGDWIESTNTLPSSSFSANYLTADSTAAPSVPNASTAAIYAENTANQLGMTDPESYWLPAVDNDADPGLVSFSVESPDPFQMPRTARFPSIGYLQYVRTGIIPDDETQPYAQQHGTPFRLLNFGPMSSQGGTSPAGVAGATYPDWAMLNLFFMPSSLLGYGSPYELFAGPVYAPVSTPVTHVIIAGVNQTQAQNPMQVTYMNTNVVNNMFLYGTYGGATSGRINPNGAVVYTTNTAIATPGITRTVPLQALLHGLQINQVVPTSGATTNNISSGTFPSEFHQPLLTGGSSVDEVGIAQDIVNYLNSSGPLRMPGEICDIPGIATLAASQNAYRNDLVRQIVGNLTTQSNTFSIWVAGQSIVKAKGNSNWGIYETGDQITSSVRYHYILERDLDPGLDGVYGNAASPGTDGVVGTLDDPGVNYYNNYYNSAIVTAFGYTYRIIYAEEIR
jgi:hypothetical protein